MKYVAAILLITGILGVGLSFAWQGIAPMAPVTPEQAEAYAADVEAAHHEMLDPSAAEVQQQEEARARIVERVQAAEAAAARRATVQRVLRYGGSLLAMIGVALFWQTRPS